MSQKGAKHVSPVVTPTPGLQLASTPSPSSPAPVTEAQGPGATTHVPVKEAELEKEKKKTHTNLKPGAKDGINVREEYGYIVTNQRCLIIQTNFSSW